MPGATTGDRGRSREEIPRIVGKEASRIFAQFEHLDSSGDLITSLHVPGLAHFLSKLQERILQLALQPDSWGGRTRARLVSEVVAARSIPAESASVEEIVHISNVVMPCLLLELGRRRRHIEIEFPANPCHSAARFGIRVGPSYPIHYITSAQLSRLAAEAGEELVGLCYFGDRQSRDSIEAELNRKNTPTNS
jgi:hypothetical protein